MRIKGHYVERQEVIFCKENDNLEKVLKTIEESGYRCIPVLDESEKEFKGNVYEVDILKKVNNSGGKIPVSSIVRDKEEVIRENSSFFDVFFSIKRLPYIAVLNEEKEFIGILTHAKVIGLLEQAWGSGYTLTLGIMEHAGALQKLTRVVDKYTETKSLITLDNDSFVRRVILTLPLELSQDIYHKIKKELEKIGFRVIHEEVRKR